MPVGRAHFLTSNSFSSFPFGEVQAQTFEVGENQRLSLNGARVYPESRS